MVGQDSLQDEKLRIYALHRDRIVQEDAVINHRMSWMLWATAILLTFWSGLTAASFVEKIITEGYRLDLALTGILVAGLGGVIAHQSKISVSAARTEVERVRDDYERIVGRENLTPELIKTVTGKVTSNKNPHLDGHYSASWMPTYFMAIWGILFINSAVNSILDLLRVLGK